MVKSGAYKPSKDSVNEEFAAGMHAMVIMTSSRIPTVSELVGDSFNWGVAAIPTVSADDIGGAIQAVPGCLCWIGTTRQRRRQLGICAVYGF